MGPAAWRQSWPIGWRGDGQGRPASCGRTCAAAATAARRQPWARGSRVDTWAVQILAKPLLGNAGLAADVAPGPTRVQVRVAAVAVVAGAWEGREGVTGRGPTAVSARPPPAARRPPPAAWGGHSPDSGAEARRLCTSSQLRQRRPGAGDGWSARYRWPLSQKQPVRKRSPPDIDWPAGEPGSPGLGDPLPCRAS